MATTSNESDSPQNNRGNEDNYGNADQNNMLKCYICLENTKDAVVNVCGDLYRWPCLRHWLETPIIKVCPACKSGINKDKLIPIYGCGNSKQEDPRNIVPPRPADQKTEPDTSEDGQLTFEIGSFLFRFLTWLYYTDLPREIPVDRQQQEQQLRQYEQYLAKLFWIGLILIPICLLLRNIYL